MRHQVNKCCYFGPSFAVQALYLSLMSEPDEGTRNEGLNCNSILRSYIVDFAQDDWCMDLIHCIF